MINKTGFYSGPIETAIFLDIDGVLNRHYEPASHPDVIQIERGNLLNRSLIDALNTLTEDTGAVIIVSSAWRKKFDNMATLLANAGVTGRVGGITPSLGDYHLRGNEILAWIKENTERLGISSYSDFRQYIILDDSEDMLLWQAKHMVHLDGESGLTRTMAYRASRQLRQFVNLKNIKTRIKSPE